MNSFFLRFTEGVEGVPRHTISRELVGGKMRILYKPNEPMKEVQSRILRFLRGCAPKFFSSSSRSGGKGAVQNARRHMLQGHAFKIDIATAFPSTNVRRLMSEIARQVQTKYLHAPSEDEWWEFLLQYAVSKKGNLPEGALTSAFLFDWYCEVFLDRELRMVCRTLSGWAPSIRFTRYADDLVFSSLFRLGRDSKRATIRSIVCRAGFKENYNKTKVVRLPRDTISITGSFVGGSSKIGVSRAWLKQTEKMLYQAQTLGVTECGHDSSVIQGRVLYLLDVLRGKERLSSLEEKVLRLYLWYANATGMDSGWATKTLMNKSRPVENGR